MRNVKFFSCNVRQCVLRFQSALADCLGALEEWLCLLVFALALIERSQVIEASSCPRVLRTKYLFIYREGTLVERLGKFVFALILVEHCQVVESGRQIWMLRT